MVIPLIGRNLRPPILPTEWDFGDVVAYVDFIRIEIDQETNGREERP